jgi:hypothetical protein
MQQCIKMLLLDIYMKLNMFRGKNTAHHQEPKTALAASGFSYVKGCWMVNVVRHTAPDHVHRLQVQQPFTYEKPEVTSAVLGS